MTQSVETTSAADAELSLPTPKERRKLREAAELTPEEVAAAVGVTPSTVRSWETGRAAPRGRKREVYVRLLTRRSAPSDQPTEPAEPSDPDPAPAPVAVPRHETEPPGQAEAPAAPTEQQAPDPAPEPKPEPEPAPTAEAPEPEPDPESESGPAPRSTPTDDFDALYAYAAPALTRQAYLLTGRRALALEAVQRAFHQAWARWPEVATDPDPVGWVRAAVYEYALSPWHQFRRAHRHPDKPPAEPADRILLDAMLALPTNHRRTVLLYDGVGLDLPDTAAETEASTPTAGNRLLHAHATLAGRIPELADVAPEEQSALLRERFTALDPAVRLDPPPAAVVRNSGERRTRLWTRAAVGLTAVIAVATAFTAATAPTKYEPPNAPGANVSGVPPHSGPQRLTQQSRALHDKLLSDPAAGPARIAPESE